jgi:hypothetical protein
MRPPLAGLSFAWVGDSVGVAIIADNHVAIASAGAIPPLVQLLAATSHDVLQGRKKGGDVSA